MIAGATVWGLLVPEMIAYAGLAGLPPQAGLYTLLVTLAAYAIFGTSRHVVVAGTSAAAVLLASTVGDLAREPRTTTSRTRLHSVLFCGGLFLLAGFCSARVHRPVPLRPVMEGFVFGLAIFVTVKQLPKLFGISGGEGDTIRQLVHVVTHLGDTSGATFAVGAGALVLLFGVERLAPEGARRSGRAGARYRDQRRARPGESRGRRSSGKVPSGLPDGRCPATSERRTSRR